MKPAMERIDVKTGELKQALERSRQAPLQDPDYRKLEAAVNTLDYLTELVADKDTTIRHLRQLLLGSSTEKTRDVLQRRYVAASLICEYWPAGVQHRSICAQAHVVK